MNKQSTYTMIRKILWIVFGFCLVGLSISAVELKRELYLGGLEVEILLFEDGDNLITKDDITSELIETFGRIEQIPIRELDVQAMEHVLLSNPFMKNVDVYVDAHEKLHVRVAQREPMIRVMHQQKVDYYLDIEGVKIPVSPHYTVRAPVANGYVPSMEEYQLNEDSHPVMKSLYYVARTIHEDRFLNSLIDQIYINDQRQLVLVPKVGVRSIIVGDSTALNDKVERLKIFYKEAIPGIAWEKYKTMDLRYQGQVVCK